MVALLIDESTWCPLIDWGMLMQTTQKRLHSFIRKRVTNFADVDDLFQTTWLEVLVNRGRFMGHSRPETWVFGIAMNLIKNYYKDAYVKNLRATPVETLDQEVDEKFEPEKIMVARETLLKTVNKFSAMPKEYQRLLKVLIENDISYQDIADRLGMPIGTVRSRLSRLRVFLRKEIQWEA